MPVAGARLGMRPRAINASMTLCSAASMPSITRLLDLAATFMGRCPERSGLHLSQNDARYIIRRMARAREHVRVDLLDACGYLIPAVVFADKQASALAPPSRQCGIAHE